MTDFENRLMDTVEEYSLGTNIEIWDIYGHLYKEGLTFEFKDYLNKGRDFESDIEELLPVIKDWKEEDPDFQRLEIKESGNKLTKTDQVVWRYTLVLKEE